MLYLYCDHLGRLCFVLPPSRALMSLMRQQHVLDHHAAGLWYAFSDCECTALV